jgi:hypothetical protein
MLYVLVWNFKEEIPTAQHISYVLGWTAIG